jgi:hypothetical protein
MRFAALVLAFVCLTSCGESYTIEPARMNVINAAADSRDSVKAAVSDFLVREGFEDLGRHDEMLDLLRSTQIAATDPLIERISRTVTFLNRPRDLTVEIADHSDGTLLGFDGGYTPATPNFIEVRVYEGRPGGASKEAHAFYERLKRVLKSRFGDNIVEINGLPETNDEEYRRVQRVNLIAGGIAWTIAFLSAFLISAGLILLVLDRATISNLPKRAIFVAVVTWLSTPVLMPVATILVAPLPNALAFPWTYPELYMKGGLYNLISFLCSFAICSAASLFLVKTRRRDSTLRGPASS